MSLLLYGANGYTGDLIARASKAAGVRPVLAGRKESAVAALATDLGVEHRAFALDDPKAVDAGLEGMQAVLHCAGPFAHTSRPMVDACLRQRVHYLDVTGEALVFESVAARDAEARERGVMLLPGVGFDVVPSDCLAAHVASRLPGATHLTLAFHSKGSLSRGTATTMVENLDKGGLVRRGGALVSVPSAWLRRDIDFGEGPRHAATIPWGDVATAWYSTRIPDIEVFLAMPRKQATALVLSRPLGPLLGTRLVQSWLKARVNARPAGPSAEKRARSETLLFGEVTRPDGARAVSRLRAPDGYDTTILTSLEIVRRVLKGDVKPGFQTPSLAYGKDLILAIEGTRREDL